MDSKSTGTPFRAATVTILYSIFVTHTITCGEVTMFCFPPYCVSRDLPSCLRNNSPGEKFLVVGIIKPELVAMACLDPICRSRAVACAREERLAVSVDRNVDLSNGRASRVPRNSDASHFIACRDWVGGGGERRRSFGDDNDARCDEDIFES